MSKVENMTIDEIKAFPEPGDAFISLLEKDPRKGVKSYAKTLKRRREREKSLLERTLRLKEIEKALYKDGYNLLCGIDEVGRGPLAGPVMAAAVIMPENSLIPGVYDSKKLSLRKREELDILIREQALDYSYFCISPKVIDKINIHEATKEAMLSAVSKLRTVPEILLIDYLKLDSAFKEISITKGDSRSYSIACASIIAKVKRDEIMRKYDEKYPEYGFCSNVGYGTKEHIDAIKKHGLTPIHRLSFCSKFVSF